MKNFLTSPIYTMKACKLLLHKNNVVTEEQALVCGPWQKTHFFSDFR